MGEKYPLVYRVVLPSGYLTFLMPTLAATDCSSQLLFTSHVKTIQRMVSQNQFDDVFLSFG